MPNRNLGECCGIKISYNTSVDRVCYFINTETVRRERKKKKGEKVISNANVSLDKRD